MVALFCFVYFLSILTLLHDFFLFLLFYPPVYTFFYHYYSCTA